MNVGLTARTRKLRESLISKACYQGKYADGIFVDVSRAKLYMDSHRENSGAEPAVIRAKILKHVLSNISIDILCDELIVGNPHADPYALPVFPEVNTKLLKEALDDGYIRPQDQATAKELLDYWEGNTISSKVSENMSDWIRDVVSTASSFISITWLDGIQHCVPNWEFVFQNGTDAIRKKIQSKLDQVFHEIDRENSTDLSSLLEKRYEYEAMLISLDALSIYLDRYQALAREKAGTEKDPRRKKELLDLARVTGSALRSPPQSFWEACQGFFTLHLILNCIDSAAFGSLCRIDQILYPSFKKDVLTEKTVSMDEAQELMECLILKVQALGAFFSRKRRLHFEGNGALPIWTVGGQSGDGGDACNELTDMILRAARSIRCNQPTISILYHQKMRDSSLVEAIETVRTGLGFPSFTNMAWVHDSFLRQGMTLEDARNSGVVGCVSCCPVDSCNTTKRLALEIIASKNLELALNRGICPVSGKQLGPDEKPAEEFESYQEVMEAFRRQLTFSIKTAVNVRNLSRHFEKRLRPNPLASALHKTPIEKGIDAVSYEDHPNNYWLNMVGMINVVNSMAVLKKLVFEEKRYKMHDFVEAMSRNWDGFEAMRLECVNKVPKYGNDDPYVDAIAREVFNLAADVAEKSYDING
ncbi:MAG: hypothetical protein HQK54_16810, partial [Oligoflexales bacterium]|nr:hypothetical protein [Oligoflexales bacterium]